MLHRTKKKNDPNEGKWIGIGGKLEENESPEECMLREAYEETGITLKNWKYKGIVTFTSDCAEGEYMHLFTADTDEQKLIACNEGELKWIPENELLTLNLWDGDKIFLELLQKNEGFFSLKLCYSGDRLIKAVLNGNNIKI